MPRPAIPCALAVLLLAALIGCSDSKPTAAIPEEKDWKSLVDGERAFGELVEFAKLGGFSHAEGGREKLETARNLIRAKLEAIGFAARDIVVDSWTQKIPNSNGIGMRSTTMKNISAVLAGKRPEVIAIGCHYDTKIMTEPFAGANDGCSGIALVIELARQLTKRAKEEGPPPFTLHFTFFDGEEAIVDWLAKYEGVPDNCYGSRRMAQKRAEYPIETLVLLDMVADKDLTLVYEKSSSQALNRLFSEGGKKYFGIDLFGNMVEMQDDHIPFKEAGMSRVIDLIDFEYGPGNSRWHSTEDRVEHCSARSLDKVGSLVMHTMPELESWLTEELAVK